MVSCKQCGAPIDSAASFCRSCGSAQPAANAGSSAPVQAQPAVAAAYAPAPVVAKKKGKKALKVVGIVVGVFVALVVWGAIIDAGKNKGRVPNDPEKPASDQKASTQSQSPPTAEQLASAQKAGLSKDFATDAWLTHRYVVNTYTRVLGGFKDADITLPSDEVIRDSLKGVRGSIRNKADQLAYDRMYALLWIDHIASGMTQSADEQSVYMHYIRSGNGCFIGVMSSFEAGHQYSPGLMKDVQECLSAQSSFKAEFDKTHQDDF